MGIILWIIFGALAGWIASKIMGRDESMGALANIVVGIIGAGLGGWISSALLGGSGITGFNIWSLLIAIAGRASAPELRRLRRRRGSGNPASGRGEIVLPLASRKKQGRRLPLYAFLCVWKHRGLLVP